MLLKTESIVLKTIKHRETSVISNFLTREEGNLTVFANGVRKLKSNLPASLFQPPVLVDAVLYFRANKDMHRVKELKTSFPFYNIFTHFQKMATAQFLTELTLKSNREKGPNPSLFDFVKESLIELEKTDPLPGLFPLFFMIKLTGHIGIAPDLRIDKSGYLDMREGVVKPDQPEHPHFMDQKNTRVLTSLFHSTAEDLNHLKVDNDQKRQLLKQLSDYFLIHIDGMKSLQSPEILKAILTK